MALAGTAKVARAEQPSAAKADEAAEQWTATGWLLTMAPEVSAVLAATLEISTAQGPDGLAATRLMASHDIEARLRAAGLSGLVPAVSKHAAKLRRQGEEERLRKQGPVKAQLRCSGVTS